MKLKPSEVRFWQEVYVASISRGELGPMAETYADCAVQRIRNRLSDPGPRPDEGRL